MILTDGFDDDRAVALPVLGVNSLEIFLPGGTARQIFFSRDTMDASELIGTIDQPVLDLIPHPMTHIGNPRRLPVPLLAFPKRPLDTLELGDVGPDTYGPVGFGSGLRKFDDAVLCPRHGRAMASLPSHQILHPAAQLIQLFNELGVGSSGKIALWGR